MMTTMLGLAGVWALAGGAPSKPTAISVVADASSALSFMS
jgi:hypothetical protein